MGFEKSVIAYFEKNVPKGCVQRIDGLAAFSNVTSYWFWRWRLDRMVRKGILVKRKSRAIWASCNGLPMYGLAPGREENRKEATSEQPARTQNRILH